MGVVYEAEDRRLGRIVALKFLPEDLANDTHALERFRREAHAASSLNHPHICTIHDIDVDDEGRTFIVMEKLEGATLAEKLAGQPLPVGEVIALGIQIADALAAAHAKGIVHRDLKPRNIFVTIDGKAKLLDFGLSKVIPQVKDTVATVSAAESLTAAGDVVGTLMYMPPEQALGNAVDARSDLFSFGVVLYEMATGKAPFREESVGAQVEAILHKVAIAPIRLNAEVPAELDCIIRRAIEKVPAKRQQSAAEIRNELQALQRQITSGTTAIVTVTSMGRRPWVIAAAVFLLAVLGACSWWLLARSRHIQWARNVALPQIADLVQRDKNVEALPLAEKAAAYIPNDPTLNHLLDQASRVVNIHSEPEGADVFMRVYSDSDKSWVHLGKTPILNKRLARSACFVWRVEMPGYATLEATVVSPLRGGGGTALFKLASSSEAPAGMVMVPGGKFRLNIPGFDDLPPVTIPDYWIDKYEVTNREYKKFLIAGGYGDSKYWKQPFLNGGRTLSFQEAVALFRDKTGRPGPATWEGGDYPEGQADFPVTGVSWYEAAAYAEFAGKSLPTIYHWNIAAGIWATNYIVPASNFGRSGLAPAGKYASIGEYGTYDQAGNAKEWCWNSAGAKHYILGGGWNEPAYMFTDADAQSPFTREANYGFRLVKYSSTPPPSSLVNLAWPYRDYNQERPVPDNIFRIYKGLYTYDKAPLNSKIEAVDESNTYWKREKITFDAAYGNERVIAYVFVPKYAHPPFQTVVYFPGSDAIYKRSSQNLNWNWERLDFIIKSGHAVVYPIYKSTYERGDQLKSDYQAATAFYREHVIDWSKDLGRTIDYIQTRSELDHERIAYFGLSWGAALGSIMTATNDRIRANIFLGGGLFQQKTLPECDPLNFAPHVKQPTLMVNGRYDAIFPTETSQDPLFRNLGALAVDKRHIIFEAGHVPPNDLVMKEALAWLDKYLGPVSER